MSFQPKFAPPLTTKNRDMVNFNLKDLKIDLAAPKAGVKTMAVPTPKATAYLSNEWMKLYQLKLRIIMI